MLSISKYRSSVITLFVILFCIFLFTKCINNQKDKTADIVTAGNFEKFAGSGKCMDCHKNIYDAHIQTAHFLTSSIVTEKNIKGSFDTGKNTFAYSNGSLMAMQKRNDGFTRLHT